MSESERIYEHLTRWVGGEESWEPSSSFKLDAPDVESHSHYLPVYDEYKTRMNEGKENEDNGEINMDGGETVEDPSSAASLHNERRDKKKHDESNKSVEDSGEGRH